MNSLSLEALIAALPEAYQPVYGYPEHDAGAQRGCADRLQQISAVYAALSGQLGRPLRVLDLGCAQGYFSLQLAALGATVTGIDSDPTSIALCQFLAAEQPALAVEFREQRIEAVLEALQPDAFDLVLGLSVFHHLVHAEGAALVQQRLALLGTQVAALVVELALASEPLYWAEALPEDPRELLADFALVHELSRHGTHLSAIERPLLVASNSHWLLPPLAGPIDQHLREPHAYAHDHYLGSRHYYRSGERLLKLYRYDVDPALDNAGELRREAALLRQPPPGLRTPRLDDMAEHEYSGWLLREWLPGRLLSASLEDGSAPPAEQVMPQVLAQLASLQAAGLYHSDLRPWNLLHQADGQVLLIDYGSMVPEPRDRAWPGNLELALLILLHELLGGELRHPEPLRPVTLSPWGLPQPWRGWLLGFWHKPLDQWLYADLATALQQALAAPPGQDPALLPEQASQLALEQGVDTLARQLAWVTWLATRQEPRVEAAEYHMQQARAQAAAAQAGATAAQARAEAELAQARAMVVMAREQVELAAEAARDAAAAARVSEAAARTSQAAVAELLASASWRLTAPLRLGLTLLQRARQLPAAAARVWQRLLTVTAAMVLRQPQLRALGLALLARVPPLQRYLEARLLAGPAPPPGQQPAEEPPELRRARRQLQRGARHRPPGA